VSASQRWVSPPPPETARREAPVTKHSAAALGHEEIDRPAEAGQTRDSPCSPQPQSAIERLLPADQAREGARWSPIEPPSVAVSKVQVLGIRQLNLRRIAAHRESAAGRRPPVVGEPD
jgi:hypothetical protein